MPNKVANDFYNFYFLVNNRINSQRFYVVQNYVEEFDSLTDKLQLSLIKEQYMPFSYQFSDAMDCLKKIK